MKPISVHAAKTNLSKLIARAQKGEEIIIGRGPVPVAKLVPIVQGKAPKREPDTWRGLLTLTPDFFEPLPDDELDLWEGKGKKF